MIVDIVPLVALAGALLWAAWASRPRRAMGIHESVEAHQRALHALAPDHDVAATSGRRN